MSECASEEASTPTVVKISPRLVSGVLSPGNKDALDWGPHGLLAYGSQSNIVVLDARTVSTVQTLQGVSRHDVTRVKWSRHLHYHDKRRPYTLRLAAADCAGVVTVWNVALGSLKAEFTQPGHKAVVDMHWMAYNDASYSLLLVLFEQSFLVLWDTEREVLVWKKDFLREVGGAKFTALSVDPFTEASLVFTSLDQLWQVDDLSPARAPQTPIRKLDVLFPPSPGLAGSGSQAQTPTDGPRKSRLLSGMQAMFQGGSGGPSLAGTSVGAGGTSSGATVHVGHHQHSGSTASNDPALTDNVESGTLGCLHDCQAAMHDPAYRDQILVVFSRYIVVVDLAIQQAIGTVVVERSLAGLFAVRVCRISGLLVCLHDSGVITVRQRRTSTLCRQPSTEDVYFAPSSGDPDLTASSLGTEKTSMTLPLSSSWAPYSGKSAQFEVHFDTLCTSEPYRMVTRNSRIVAFAQFPSLKVSAEASHASDLPGERLQAAIVLQDGRTLFYTLLSPACDSKSGKPRLVLTANIETVSTVPHCVKMCPPVTFKNWKTYRPLLACAVGTGNVQVLNMATGAVERNICVHTTAVRGIEWTGLTSFLSFANATLQVTSSQNSNMKNELCLTEVTSGRVRQIRADRADEKPIEQVAVSKNGQYFIVAFRDQPFELWDLRSLSLLSAVSQSFRSITCIEWSPKPVFRRKPSETGEEFLARSPAKRTEPIFLKASFDNSSLGEASLSESATASRLAVAQSLSLDGKMPYSSKSQQQQQQYIKENFLAVDVHNKVLFFTVEGSVIKSNMRILVPTTPGAITCMALKADKLVLGDTDGNLSIWDITTNKGDVTQAQRGLVRKVVFAPGRGNMKLIVLFQDNVELWEAMENHTLNRLTSLKTARLEVSHVGWAGSVGPFIAWANGTISIMDMELKSHLNSPIAEYFFEEMPFLPAVLSPCSAFHLKSILQHVTRDILENEEPWTLVGSSGKVFLNSEDTILARSMLADLTFEIWDALTRASVATRALIIARLFGDEEAVRFWSLFQSLVSSHRDKLSPSLDLFLPCSEYRERQLHKALVHESRRGNNYQLTQRCVNEFLLLGHADRAVQLLLETEPSNPSFTHDSLRACLIACLRTEHVTHSSVVKLVATNLIASGNTELGVQLLCVIRKALDACRYLQSNAQWETSVALAKCSLSQADGIDVVRKWADHLSLVATNQRCRAALALLSVGEIGRCVQLLASNQMLERAVLLAEAAEEEKLAVDWGSVKEEYRLPALRLSYARYLHAIGNSDAALAFCMKGLDMPEAEDLKKEIEIILEDNSSIHASSRRSSVSTLASRPASAAVP